MAAFRIALRSLARRKVRMGLIASLVTIGTVFIAFGGTFAASARIGSREAIIDYFTGDLVLYSPRSQDVPSPFSFTAPLPVVEKASAVLDYLASNPRVASSVGIAQNFGLISVERNGSTLELPFQYYAVDPVRYRNTFDNMEVVSGSWFGDAVGESTGVMVSAFQAGKFKEKYGVDLAVDEKITLLSLTGGGSVNATSSVFRGTYLPRHYSNVFNYISFMDIATYSALYNFTGVSSDSLPRGVNDAFAAESDEDIFALAGGGAFDRIDTDALRSEELTGYTMIAVRLTPGSRPQALLDDLAASGFALISVPWNRASGFFAGIADILQAVIYGATMLIFLIVTLILMNTLIINILERTGEIGTLRAIGADRSFVSAIFLWESLILNGSAALAGLLVATAAPFVNALVLVLSVSFLATVYPIRVAVSVSPLTAMSGK
jgi:ABC-type antimicrobial peptide transport system permease subunit